MIDSFSKTISIPIKKVHKAIEMINKLLEKGKATVKFMQQITGLLNWMCRCLYPARAFTMHIYAKFNNEALKKHHHIRVDRELKADLKVWRMLLVNPEIYSHPFFDFNSSVIADEVGFFTDASKNENLGFGCVCFPNYTYARWEEGFISLSNPSIDYLELFALMVAIVLWADRFKNGRIIVNCDNMGMVFIINRASAKNPRAMSLIRLITLVSMKNNCRFFARHIKGVKNKMADDLSRMKMESFWLNAKNNHKGEVWNAEPDKLPGALWPLSRV